MEEWVTTVVLKYGPQTSSIVIISEFTRDTNYWLIPDLLNQKHKAGPSNLCYKSCSDNSHIC